LDHENLWVVADRIKTLLDRVTDELKQTPQCNLTELLGAAFDELKRFVDELLAASS
jgi:hypothetical protein